MKVNKVIERLQKLKEKYGNIECDMYMEDIDGTQTGVDEINNIDITLNVNGKVASICIAHFNEKVQ